MIQFFELKQTYENITRAITSGTEPGSDLSVILHFLRELASNNGEFLTPIQEESNSIGFTKSQFRFIYEDLTPGLIKKICRERSNDEQYLSLCGNILEAFLDLFNICLNKGIFNIEFLLACRQIFDYDCQLHKWHFQIPDQTLQRLFTKGSGQQWRQELKEGDNVDALIHYYDRQGISKGAGWSQAQIIRVEGDTLLIDFLLEPSLSKRELDRWSIELAPFESETKQIWEWKKTLNVDDNVDAQDDTFKWLKSTIIKIYEERDDEKVYPMAVIGLRVYTSTGHRKDDRGNYDGFGDRFDEKIPLFSPKITKFRTNSIKQGNDDDGELDESLDEFMEVEQGLSRNWAVPRPRKCTSYEYIKIINQFCEKGGLDLILNTLQNTESSEEADGFNLTVIAILVSMVSLPTMIYHKQVIDDYGKKFIAIGQKRLLNAPDKALRDVRREAIEAIVKAVDQLNKRVEKKEEREILTELLKLDVSLLCLNSSFLQRRIQGISDLTQLIKNNRIYSSKLTGKHIIDWLIKNQVLNLLFDLKKTHLQIVQRCDEIIRLLLNEEQLTEERLSQFWGLTKTDMRVEVYKIISDCTFSFQQQHLDFIFDKICNDIPLEKLDMDDFNCLSELGKYSKDKDFGFKDKVTKFFWDLIVKSGSKNTELLDNCSQMYRDMVKYSNIEQKQEILKNLLQAIKDPLIKTTIPSIKLLKGLIKDQYERTSSSYTYGYTNSNSTGVYVNQNNVGTYPIQQTNQTTYGTQAGGSALRTRTPQKQQKGPDDPQDQNVESVSESIEKVEEPIPEQKLTLQSILKSLQEDDKIIDSILEDLSHYYKKALKYIKDQGQENQNIDTKKLFVQDGTYSHYVEVDERMQFIQFFAQYSNDYCISKKELGVIYDLLVANSCSQQDEQGFLIWCKSSCESQTQSQSILDLDEVGQFFTEKISQKLFDVKNISSVGLEFLQQYFISLNEREGNLEKVQQKQNNNSYQNGNNGKWTTSYSWVNGNKVNSYSSDKKDESYIPQFIVKVDPQNLLELEIIWTLVLTTQQPEVVKKVIDFFIKIHTSISKDLKISRKQILENLIKRCMQIINESENFAQIRVVRLLKNLIDQTEEQGVGNVLPHGALMKGESFEIFVKNKKVTHMAGQLQIQVYSNTTLWELKQEISHVLDFNARYLILYYGQNQQQNEFKDMDNGKTMKTLGITAGQVFNAQRRIPDEYISVSPLLSQNGEITIQARRIFEQWFDMYAEADGTWSTLSAGYFIQGCCGDPPSVPNDNRVTSLFNTYDTDKDGKIQKEEFMSFYQIASRDRPQTVRENLKAHNVRPDLIKWSEFRDEKSIQIEELPRFFMSRDSTNFNQLMQLLNNQDQEVSKEVWDLVQMLATNQNFYKRVLNLEIAKSNQSQDIDWSQFFDKKQSYKLLYTLQIVQAVLQDGEHETKRAKCLNSQAFHTIKIQSVSYRQNQQEKLNQQNPQKEQTEETSEVPLLKASSVVSNNLEEEIQLRAQWAEDFIEKGGFQYILKEFMNLNMNINKLDENSEQIDLKYLAFMLHLLRTFLMAALSTNDSNAYQTATLARKNSTIEKSNSQIDGTLENDPQSQNNFEDETLGSSFKQLQKLLDGPKGVEILKELNYNELQQKGLSIVWQVLKKDKMIFEEKLIIDNAMNLWVGCIKHQPELFSQFKNSNISNENIKSEDFLIQGLLECKYDQVREQFKSTIASICLNNTIDEQSPIEFAIKLLADNLQKISGKQSMQYLSLFCNLLDQYREIQNDGKLVVVQPQALLSAVINQISEENNRSKTLRDDQNSDDIAQQNSKESSTLLLGLMQLAGKVLDNFVEEEQIQDNISQQDSQKQQEDLINEIFSKYLFPSVFSINQNKKEIQMAQVIDQKNSSKTVNSIQERNQATQVAYRLLLGLLKRNQQLMEYFLKNQLKILMDFVQRSNQWGYSPPIASTQGQQYVGLRNPGCICYMNSMLQQFFMIPPLRYNLLSTDDNIEEDIKLYKGDYIDDNVLHQLQHVMANLELSERSDYLPKGFCFAFKDFEGLPTNTAEQKDAQEFLNIIFDKIETSLKNTPKKYLFQSVFGGKTCSQLVCKECGKVKNRIEDMNNLSLTVKDLKGVYESLQKQIEGEVISDYECSGCKKKVDIHKRTLIAETPNILIIHLQRILFDFNTFQNEKMNQYFEFPKTLDLKPYSYYEVMSKEERVENTNNNDEEVKNNKEDEENPEPIHEDCFEYVLSGVTVHSGSANAGHYWSLISTERDGLGRKKAINQLESDKWMEFNDSHVRDFDVQKLKDEAFGGDGGNQSFGVSSFDGWGIGGNSSFGKSGYMLFYERVQKKPIKILKLDEENKEVITEISYYQCVEANEKPNRIFQQVLEENLKFGFEQDIYQQEFFDFMYGVQKTITQYNYNQDNVKELTKLAIDIGCKSTLEIFAKSSQNNKIEEHIQVLLDLIHKDKSLTLHKQFLEDQYEKDGFDYLFQLLLECPDNKVRTCVANLLKYILIKLKTVEKDYLFEPEDYEVQGDNGESMTMQKYKSLSSRFIIRAIDLFNTRVAKNWYNFEQFHELIYTFALADETYIEEQILLPNQNQNKNLIFDTQSESARIGLNFFAKIKFVQKACDFMLGKKSPLCKADDKRFELGSFSSTPEFGGCIKLITALISDEQIQNEYPLSEQDKELLLHPHLLKTILGSPSASKPFGIILAETCKDNYKLSKKISKVFLRSIESAHLDAVSGYLKALKPFLLMNDSLKKQKLEWVFGIPDLISKKNQGEKRPKYGLELVDRINDEILQFETPIIFPSQSSDYALVNQIYKSKGKWDIQCISCLKELLALMKKDQVIARFVYDLPSLSYQGARFIDWFKPYLVEQLFEQQKLSQGALMHFKQKLESIQKALNNYNTLEPLFKQYEQEDLKKIENLKEGEYVDLQSEFLRFYQNCELEAIPHFPPQIIIGQIIGEEKELITFDDHPLVKVQIFQHECEYSYGAPTGLFNLSIPHKIRKTGTYSTESYFQYKRAIQAGQERERNLENEDIKNELSEQQRMGAEDPAVQKVEQSAVPTPAYDESFIFNTKDWNSHKKVDSILLRIMIVNKTQDTDVKVWYRLAYKNQENQNDMNVKLANSKRKTYLSAKNIRLMETLCKIDPSKPYFFENLNNLSVELDVTVRDPNYGNQGGQRKVHYAPQTSETFFQGTQTNEFDDDERDDDQNYAQYQQNPNYEGYIPTATQNAEMETLLNINQPQNSYGEAQSNGSTEAVMDEQNIGDSGNISGNGDIEEGNNLYNGISICKNCQATISNNEFSCQACGDFNASNQ